MSVGMRWVLALLACALAAAVLPSRVVPSGPQAPARTDFRFLDGDATAQQAFRGAVAAARPEARRLIERVAGQVEVSFAPIPDGGALGVTTGHEGAFSVDIDLARSTAAGGPRAVQRVVLHELGHVVDFALLSEAQRAQLDGQFPAGYACPRQGCAVREERFAETFAKWSLGDIGASLYVGYAVPPPVVTLDRWGEPLAAWTSG